MATGRTRLIVTGVARSGTTAMAELLNSHPEICVGIERFKFKYLRDKVFDAGLFETDRFFDFQEGDTNLLPEKRPNWVPHYLRMALKWEKAAVVGDKTPDLMPVLPAFMEQNPDFKFICILRNLKDVGLSWQRRADRKSDAWPKGRGFAAACESWSNQHEELREMMRDKALRKRLLLLDYDRMYESPELTERALLSFLGVKEAQAFKDLLSEHAEFASTNGAPKVPKKFAEAYLAVDMDAFRSLRKLSLEQVANWADTGAAKGQTPKDSGAA